MKNLLFFFTMLIAATVSAQDFEDSVFLSRINMERAKFGLAQVEYYNYYDSATTYHTCWMVDHDSLSHFEYDNKKYYTFGDRLYRFVPNFTNVNVGPNWIQCENATCFVLPYGKIYPTEKKAIIDMVNDCVDRWMHSPGHRKAILQPKARKTAFSMEYKKADLSKYGVIRYQGYATMVIGNF